MSGVATATGFIGSVSTGGTGTADSQLLGRVERLEQRGLYRSISDPQAVFADLNAPLDSEIANYLYTWPGTVGVGVGTVNSAYAVGDKFGYTRPSDNAFFAWEVTRAEYADYPWYTISAFRTHSGLGADQKSIVKRLCDNLMADYKDGNDCRFVRAYIDGNMHGFEFTTTRRDLHPALAGPSLCRLVSEGYSFTWSPGLAQYLRTDMVVIDDKKQYIVLRTPESTDDIALRPVTDTAQSLYRAL